MVQKQPTFPYPIARRASVALVAAVIGWACGGPAELPPSIECPAPPPQNCQPGAYQGPAVDTVALPVEGREDHYEIDRLADNVNSPLDELGMAFARTPEGTVALLTQERRSDSAHQGVEALRMRGALDFTPLGDVGLARVGGSCSVDPRTMTVYFAAQPAGAVAGDFDIYSAHLEGAGGVLRFTHVTRLDERVNKPGAWDGQPAVSPDGRYLYFASDRSGGHGGTDLYYCTRTGEGAWSDAVNAGPAVNSSCDELSPFICADNRTLLFSSSGHATVGGYDVFRATISNGVAHDVVNVGPPVNTASDEIFPSAPGTPDTLLYYASNQAASAGGFDMFALRRIPHARHLMAEAPRERPMPAPTIEQLPVTPKKLIIDTIPKPDTIALNGRVLDARTHAGIPAAVVTWRNLDSRATGSTVADTGGGYHVQLKTESRYEVNAQAPRYFYDVVALQTPARAEVNPPIHHDFLLRETLSVRVNFPVNAFDKPYPNTLDDDGNETAITVVQAMDLLAENLQLSLDKLQRLIVIGHTDSSASDAYNEELGLKRAQYFKNQLIKRGIPAGLIEVLTRGRRVPVPRRPDEPQERFYLRCRRVEMIKVFKTE